MLWCKFPKSKIVVDIGGGSGAFIQRVLDLNPEIDGVLFDQESTINNIDPLYFLEYKNRINLVSGDFFNDKTIPSNGDIYIICRTLLNWSNKDAITIINNCASRMPKHSKIIIIDFIIPDITHSKYQRAVLNDISLYTIMDSGIRTKNEWLSKWGLDNFRINYTNLKIN